MCGGILSYYSRSLRQQTSDHPCCARLPRLTTLMSEVVGEVPASQALFEIRTCFVHASITSQNLIQTGCE